MTNYNDGNWWGWNGGARPVHPDTLVEAVLNSGTRRPTNAAMLDWSGPDVLPTSHIIAFRVIKEHREPREFWIMLPRPGGSFGPIVHAQKPAELDGYYSPIHVREVLE